MQATLVFAILAVVGSMDFSKREPVGQTPHRDKDYSRHVEALKERLPSDDFQFVIEKPFVVIGDESLEMVKKRASGTVRWTVERLKKQYFAEDTTGIIDIWLFKDKASYEENCERIVGYKPHTPFGFYSSTRRAIIMNISTGGGTLVHEIVHPFIETNFPECPSWFNEGLASLYEQSQDNDGQIWGMTNWRLRGLQAAIQDDTLPGFKELCATTTDEFYNGQRGDNYAQARYLCFYLQEKKLLNKFYHSFRKNIDDDPTGFQALSTILGNPEFEDFEQQWKEYCLKLRF